MPFHRVTLNDLERRNGRYFALSHRVRQHIKVVEVRPTLYATKCSQILYYQQRMI